MAFAEYPVVASSGSGGITKVADSIERNALTPADGDIVIQLDNDFLYEWNGSSWAVLADRTWQTAGSILGAKTFDTASRWSVATNQQVFGVTNTITDNYNAPSANRVYTIPDVGADAAYVMTAGNQTIGGTKTFSSAVVINPTTNQLVFGLTNTTTINSVAPSASRIYTIPDAGADASFVMTAGNQTVGGTKTFSSAIAITPTSNQIVLGTTNTATISASAPAASRTYTIADPGQNASFVMDRGTQTLQGTYTFTQQTLTQNVTSSVAGLFKITSSATNPQLYSEYEGTAATAQTWRVGLNTDGSNVGSYVIYDFTATLPRATVTTAGQFQLPAASNQIRLSSSVNQLTITSGTSAAARTYTVPDTGTTDTFAMLGGSQTFGGAKTFSSAVTVSAASNQLVLSSGINQLTLNSSTSAAARTYAFPDVGTSGTVAMLEGAQTFSALKTFSSGLAISGGSAANNTIWVASNTFNIRGGTSGTDIYNTSGTVTVDITDGGSVALGPAGQYGLRMESGTFANASTSLLANCYINATHAGRSDTTRAGGGILVDAPSTDASNVITFYANLDNATTITTATNIGGALPTGAWTWGPTTGSANITHTIRSNSGQLDVDFRTGGSVTLSAYPSTSGDVFQFVNRTVGSTTRFYSSSVSSADTIVGTYNSAGGWTFGPTSGSTNVNQTFINRSTADADTVCIIQKGAATTTTANNFVFFRINNGATESGRISANGASAAGFQTNSDRRLKKNINSLSGELNRVLALNPVSFDYITGGFQTGFLADELQKIYPDAVSANESTPEKYLSVTGWDKTTARLVKAIQELHAELKTTQEELASLRSA